MRASDIACVILREKGRRGTGRSRSGLTIWLQPSGPCCVGTVEECWRPWWPEALALRMYMRRKPKLISPCYLCYSYEGDPKSKVS